MKFGRKPATQIGCGDFTMYISRSPAQCMRIALHSMAALESMPVLQLYRSILKAAKHFPSRKRDRIIQVGGGN